MYNKIHFREVLAWISLVIAFILFSVAIAFSQTKSINVENIDGQVHVKIKKTENGKTTNIDTSFSVTDDMNVDEIIESLEESENFGKNEKTIIINRKSNGGNNKRKQIIMDFDFPEMSKEDKEKLHKEWKESMKDLKQGIEKMKESLKGLDIRIETDVDHKNGFHFNFKLPDEDSDGENDCNGYSYSYNFSDSDDNEIDSLYDEGFIIIEGGKDEKPPELEKIISSKKGKQIFVYKRSGASSDFEKNNSDKKRDDQEKNKQGIQNLYCYPNPTSGKFKLTFNSTNKNDLTIQVLDGSSKEVYSEKLIDFNGEYSGEIDLKNKSKGNYFLKITQGGKSVSKKIVLN